MPAPGHRSRAIAAGHKRYFTGKPCKHGHIAERCTSDGQCCECSRLKGYAAFLADRAGASRRSGEYRKKNTERVNAARQARRAKNPERERAYMRDWTSKNPEKLAAYRARYNTAERRSKKAAYSTEWIAKNRAKHRTYLRKSRARRKGVAGEHTAADIEQIVKMQRGRCAHCRSTLPGRYHVDHIRPLAKGGTNDRRNLQVLCPPCNLRKSAMDPIDFARREGRLL